jgi:peptidyl-prolyl cis-trans isomerase SurA
MCAVDARVQIILKELSVVLRQYLKFVALGAILVLPFLLTSCAGTNANGREDLAAVVNGKEIKMDELDHAIERQLKQDGQQMSQLSPIAQAAARMQALQSMISREVMFQKAEQEKAAADEKEVEQTFASQKQQTGLSEEEWQKQLKDVGISENEIKDDIRKSLAIDKLQKNAISKVKNPSDREIVDYFNANPDQFKLGKAVDFAWIVVDPGNNNVKNDAVGDEAAKAKIARIAGLLKNNADFATVARNESEHESFQKGGDMGWLTEDQISQTLTPELATKLFGMTEGQITEPIQFKKAWLIFKLTAKRTQEQKLTIDDATVRSQISQGLLNQRQQLLLGALEADTINSARVENYLAKRIVDNPDNFGSGRQSGLAAKPADQKPADQKPAKP